MATLMLCRVGVQPPAVAEEGACMGECCTCQGGHPRSGLALATMRLTFLLILLSGSDHLEPSMSARLGGLGA